MMPGRPNQTPQGGFFDNTVKEATDRATKSLLREIVTVAVLTSPAWLVLFVLRPKSEA